MRQVGYREGKWWWLAEHGQGPKWSVCRGQRRGVGWVGYIGEGEIWMR